MTTHTIAAPSSPSSEDGDAPFADLCVDHVEFHVADLRATVERLRTGYGLRVLVPPTRSTAGGVHDSALVGRNGIRLLLTQALSTDHAAWSYVQRHGDGVADIALRVPDVHAAHAELVTRGAADVVPPRRTDGCVTATVAGFGDVRHTLVERDSDVPPDRIPGLPDPRPVTGSGSGRDSASGPDSGSGLGSRSRSGCGSGADPDSDPDVDSDSDSDSDDVGLLGIDHFAVCLPAGDLATVARFYTEVFGMSVVFEETIEVGPMGMNSTVVQSPNAEVTLTLIEPRAGAEAGQIESFLDDHGGAGVQHVAFASDDIIRTVGSMAERGVPFLRTPAAYYDMLTDRLTPLRHSPDQLRRLQVLVDEDHDGQLFQIFTRSAHPRGTFFFEVIERIRARTFGSNNVRALYEAIELQRRAAGAAK